MKKTSITSFDFDSCVLLTYAVATFINLVGDLGPRVFPAEMSESCTRESPGKAHQSSKD